MQRSETCALILLVLSLAKVAQASPLIDAALAEGRIGEQSDGYLGFVETPPDALLDAVRDINIRRREGYTRKALETNVTIAEFAAATACRVFAQLEVGRAYRIGDQPWHVREDDADIRPKYCLDPKAQ